MKELKDTMQNNIQMAKENTEIIDKLQTKGEQMEQATGAFRSMATAFKQQ